MMWEDLSSLKWLLGVAVVGLPSEEISWECVRRRARMKED